MAKPTDFVQGTLDLLILKTISLDDRQAHPPGFTRSSPDPAGVPVPGATPSGTAGLDQGRVAPDRDRANGKVLLPYTFGTETTGKGIGKLGSAVEGHQHRGPGGLAMRMLDKARLRLRSLFRSPNVDFELEAELRFYLDQLIEENISSGMPPEEASQAARRKIGGI